jgi:surface carbohydrate biosynthesis protein
MNIYLHVENSARELDSKLLLAAVAAAKGHNVIVSDLSGIKRGMRSKTLAPGIFHTKSLTPGIRKIASHQSMIDSGFIITSIDEEGGLVDYGYDKFAKIRYSEQTIRQASAIFGWGNEDVETLKKIYPKYSSKIYNTGSPRADLWRPFFSGYWGTLQEKPKRPFLLISSNMGFANNINQFHKIIKSHKNSGYYQRDPEMFAWHFGHFAEEGRLIFSFIKAIQHLAHNNNGYDIVLRPHLNENIEAWKVYLEDIPNVHVIRKESINAWVNQAFAVMHNGCTTALEATVSRKPILTYIPFKQEYARELANELGYRVESPDELLTKVNAIFETLQVNGQKKSEEKIPEIVSKKINLDNNKLASERIVEVWESLNSNDFSKASNWTKFQWILKAMKLKDIVGVGLKKLSPRRFGINQENHKFPSLKRGDVCERINKLQNLLGIDKELECSILSERTILIKPH